MAINQAIQREYRREIEHAKCDLRDLIISKNCAPIMLRLAFHDAGNYDAKTNTGGANGSIRNPVEGANPANKGLQVAIDFCDQIKMKHPMVTFADLYQLAGVVAVEVTGGPEIDFVPGRMDTLIPDVVRLPNPNGGPPHLREVFYRMGLSDKDIVALSGAHTLGRAHKDRSGFDGPFTEEPFVFDNSYFCGLLEGETEGLLQLPTDQALVKDHKFRKYVQRYAKCEETFFRDYAESHKKMSELGFRTHKCGSS